MLSAALHQNPQSYHLLHTQCDFLRNKGKTEWALKLAKQAVNCAPSEFVTWAKLTEVYIDMGMYDSVGGFANNRYSSYGTLITSQHDPTRLF